MRDGYRGHPNRPDTLHHDNIVQHYRHPLQAMERGGQAASTTNHGFAAYRIGDAEDGRSGAQQDALRITATQVRRLVGGIGNSVGAPGHTPRRLTLEAAVIALAADD